MRIGESGICGDDDPLRRLRLHRTFSERIRTRIHEVEVKVENHAKVVDFDFKPEVVQVSNANGKDLAAETLPTGARLSPGEAVTRLSTSKELLD